MPVYLSAQFFDDFSTPGLQQWAGDTEDFKVTANEELQLNANMAGTSWLYTNVQVPDSAVWAIYLRLEFAPSGSNNFKWVLQSTNPAQNELNGYGIQLGESGSDDALELVRWNNGTSTVIGRMSSGFAGIEPVTIRMKVSKLGNKFKLLAAYDGTDIYTDSLEVVDDVFKPGPSMTTGIICNYTSTRADLFYFDDYSISRNTPDIQAPEVIDVASSSNQLTIDFNEIVSLDNTMFDIKPGSFQIDHKLFRNGASLKLNVSPAFTSLTDYVLTISNLKDIHDNTAENIIIPFQYIETRSAEPFELVINEIMAAPNDETSLPDVEYLELFNRTSEYLQIKDLFILDKSKAVPLPKYTFPPQSYLILCATEDTSVLSKYGQVIGVNDFIGLNNAADFIQIRNTNGLFIHGVDYSDNWYQDNQKDDGGYSLELIHPDLACSQRAVFRASESLYGGTPGEENSIYTLDFKDQLKIEELSVINNQQVKLSFNQWLSPTGQTLNHLSFMPHLDIDQFELRMDQPNTLDLILNNPLENGQLYNIELQNDFKNCLHQSIDTTITAQFGVPAEPEFNQIIISELMFDPNNGESQWVEVYNASEEVFEFTYLVMKFIDNDGEDQTTIGLESQILPGQYFVFSENSAQVAESYNAPYPNQILEVDLPSMNRGKGIVQLWYIFGADAKLLDSVCYNEDWHSAFLSEEKGVALERLRFSIPACESSNWQSAAESALFGTPTGSNSQQLQSSSVNDKEFMLLSPTFSPDGDGFEDFAVIQYKHQSENHPPPQLNLNIYTPDGRLVNPLYSNYSLSSNSQLIWDGSMTNGKLAPEGFYLIHAKTFSEKGNINNWQATVYLIYQE